MSRLLSLTKPVQHALRDWIVGVLQRDSGTAINYDTPLGDAGLFGPASVTWRIHADFPGMMAGGVAALMLQTLHPRALAGVWDHSAFRTDILGRLRRTTAFVAGTTYAPTAEAEKLIAMVRGIHRKVRGTTPDGQRYSAMNADLLTWVHCTEMASFLAGYELYRGVALPTAVKDRYFAETAVIARALGAKQVPESEQAMQQYFAAVQAQLVFSERSSAVLQVLAEISLPIPLAGAARELFLGAGAALLPAWARQQLQFSRLQQARHQAAARVLKQMAPLLRAALSEGVGARSCRRVGLAYSQLGRMPPNLND
ncbi:MAG: oxygenase MpaB family protein [Pseudomonadota bacterium]